MISISIYHILIICCIFKLVSIYTDYKFLMLLFMFSIILLLIIKNNDIQIKLPMIEMENNNKTFENEKSELLNLVLTLDDNIYEKNIKNDLIKQIELFNENTSLIFYDKLKYCKYYLDIIYDQKNNIINIAKSFIITLPNYENYKFYEKFCFNLYKHINNILNMISHNCPSYNKFFITYNQFDNISSYEQI